MTSCKIRVLKRPPKGYKISDVARSLEQGKSLACSTPKDYHPVLVKTRKRDGNAEVFPYHIWTKGEHY